MCARLGTRFGNPRDVHAVNVVLHGAELLAAVRAVVGRVGDAGRSANLIEADVGARVVLIIGALIVPAVSRLSITTGIPCLVLLRWILEMVARTLP